MTTKKKSTLQKCARRRRGVVTARTEPPFDVNATEAALANTLYVIRRDYGSIDRFMKLAQESEAAAAAASAEKELSACVTRIRDGRKYAHA